MSLRKIQGSSPHRLGPKFGRAIASLAAVVVATAMGVPAQSAGIDDDVDGVGVSVIHNGDAYNDDNSVTSGDDLALSLEYEDAILPGTTVVFDIGNDFSFSTDFPDVSAIESFATETAHELEIKFSEKLGEIGSDELELEFSLDEDAQEQTVDLDWELIPGIAAPLNEGLDDEAENQNDDDGDSAGDIDETAESDESSEEESTNESSEQDAVEGETSDPEGDDSEVEEGDDDSAQEEPESSLAPLAAGPDEVTPPFVHWDVRDEGGNLVEGATFEVQGPYESGGWVGGSWGNTRADVEDCESGSCAGPDLDADSGGFAVSQFDGHHVDSDNRYRIRQVEAPDGYYFTESDDWQEIPSWSGNWSDPWASNDTYDFGTFEVAEVGSESPVCAAGYVYAVSSSGQMQEVDPSGNVTPLGTTADTSSFNGLGIGANGQTAYAYERGNDAYSATIWEYNIDDGTWSDTGVSVDSSFQGNTAQFVAGSVDLLTDEFYFGGFGTKRLGVGPGAANHTVFHTWKWSPGASSTTYVGYIDIEQGSTDELNNGDMAFDSSGNLFVVRGVLGTTSIYSVTHTDLANASGGLINSSHTNDRSTMSQVNGVAFDASGKAFLGASSQMNSYSMPNWSNSSTVTTNLSDSTDLASCSSPATLTLEKFVDGERVNSDDQFELSIEQGGQEIGSTTTEGSDLGLQSKRVGPVPVVRGIVVEISESFTNNNDEEYASSYQCFADGELISEASGDGTSVTYTVPTAGEEFLCQFHNSPLIADVTVHKDVADSSGENAQPYDGWPVGATSDGDGTLEDSGTQNTDSSGNATWDLVFDDSDESAEVNIYEEMEPGYEFGEGICEVTKLDGSRTLTELGGPAGTSLEDIEPSDSVSCSFVNNEKGGSVAWKKVDEDDASLAGSEWELSGPGGYSEVIVDNEAPDVDGDDGAFLVEDLVWGDYTLTETQAPEGYEISSDASNGYSFTIEKGDRHIQLSDVVNEQKPGSVAWDKVDADNGDLLADSEWELSGPDGYSEVIVDNEAPDVDGDDGAFLVEDLVWGDYTLTETRAPDGYTGDAEIEFTIGVGEDEELNWEFTGDQALENERALSTLVVQKQWIIGEISYFDGDQPDGHATTLELVINDDTKDAEFGEEITELVAGDHAIIDEGDTIIDNDQCELESAVITEINGHNADEELGYDHTLEEGENTVVITNTIDCESTLTLTKTVEGDADPVSWTLIASPDAGDDISGPTGVLGEVTPDVVYTLSEVADENSEEAVNYVGDEDWTCEALDEDGEPLGNIDLGDYDGTNGEVSVPFGTNVSCDIVNRTAELTLLKHVINDDGGNLSPSDWTLKASPSQDGAGKTVSGSAEVGSANTFEILPNASYEISEDENGSGQYAYLPTKIERYTGDVDDLDLDNDALWEEITDADQVSAAAGEHLIIRFVNDDAPSVTLPFTGGIGIETYLIVGAALLLLSLATGVTISRRNAKKRIQA